MAYSAGMLDKRVKILNRKEQTSGKFGIDSSGIEWQDDGEVWASVEWTKGKRAMNVGAIDIYGIVMIRMYWNNIVNERSRIVYDGKTYQVLGETLHADRQENTIQFHAQAVINDK